MAKTADATDADFAEAEDLFGANTEGATGTDFDEADDLLNSVQEDDAEGWVPTEANESISGVVVRIGETRSDFATSEEDAMCPTVTIQTKEGDKYRVIGYSTVLRRELQDASPQVGDLMAVKYFGEKPNRGGRFQGKMSKRYGVAVKHR